MGMRAYLPGDTRRMAASRSLGSVASDPPNELGDDGLIDWSRTLIDSAASKAPKGGELTGPNPTDRRKKGSKHHVITDAQGIPLATELTGAQRHDSTQMLPLVDAIPPIQGPRGRPQAPRSDAG